MLNHSHPLPKKFNIHASTTPIFFSQNYPPEIEFERKLFLAYQDALLLEESINKEIYDYYYPFAEIELNIFNFTGTNQNDFIDSINNHISERLRHLDGEKLEKFEVSLRLTQKSSQALFKQLLTDSRGIPDREREKYLIALNRLNAHHTLKLIYQSHPPSEEELARLFSYALINLQLDRMKAIIELGFNVQQKFDFHGINGFFQDLRINDNWILFMCMLLDRILRDKLMQLPTASEIKNAPAVQRTRDILNFLIETGLSCDHKVVGLHLSNDHDANEESSSTLRELMDRLNKECDEFASEDPKIIALNKVYKEICSLIINAPKPTSTPRLA